MSVILYNASNSLLTEEENQIMIDIFGYSSTVFIGTMMFPQIIKMFISQNTRDLSTAFMAFSLIGSLLRIVYGVLISQIAVIAVPALGSLQTLILIVGKCFFDNKEKNMTEDVGKEKLKKILDIDDDMRVGLSEMLRKEADDLEEMLKLLNDYVEIGNIHGRDDFSNFVVLFHEYYFKYDKIRKKRERRDKCLKFLGRSPQ